MVFLEKLHLHGEIGKQTDTQNLIQYSLTH